MVGARDEDEARPGISLAMNAPWAGGMLALSSRWITSVGTSTLGSR